MARTTVYCFLRKVFTFRSLTVQWDIPEGSLEVASKCPLMGGDAMGVSRNKGIPLMRVQGLTEQSNFHKEAA